MSQWTDIMCPDKKSPDQNSYMTLSTGWLRLSLIVHSQLMCSNDKDLTLYVGVDWVLLCSMWKLLREKVGVPSLCCFFWVLMFDLFRITFSGGGDQQTTGPIIQVEATLYLLHLSVSRSHTWVLRKAELCKSIFASHNRVFFLLFSFFKWIWCFKIALSQVTSGLGQQTIGPISWSKPLYTSWTL